MTKKTVEQNVAFGIDLGTTNSTAAFVGPDDVAQSIKNREGQLLTRSALFFEDSGEVLVGEAAFNAGTLEPDRLILRPKLMMDREDVVATHPDSLQGYTAPETSALIIKKVKDDSEAALERELAEVVITVPAAAGQTQRQNTVDAARIAGFVRVHLMPEPVAAYLGYAGSRLSETKETVAVVDIGGGTADIAVLSVAQEEIEVISLGGDAHLGGEDFDALPVSWLRELLPNDVEAEVVRDPSLLAMLIQAAVQAKHHLSVATSYRGHLHLPTHPTKFKLTRDEFEEMAAPLLERVRTTVLATANENGLTPAKVDKVVLAGGMTRMPAIETVVGACFPAAQLLTGCERDLVIAHGAARKHQMVLSEEGGESRALPSPTHSLKSISSSEIGVVAVDEKRLLAGETENDARVFSSIIPAGAELPAKRSKRYSLVSPAQIAVDIAIAECVGDHWTDIESVEFTGLQPGATADRIEVSFSLDSSGLLDVRAVDLATDAELKHQVSIRKALDDSQVACARRALCETRIA